MPFAKVVVESPATTANLGPGYDVFGLALQQPSDKVTLEPISKGVEIEIANHSVATIPTTPERNTAGVVANQILKEFSLKTGVLIKIRKNIWPGMGLGSSAASAAAVAYGMNIMFNLKLNKTQLIRLAAKGEALSAGFEHADNVSAAIYGDFVIVKSYSPLEIVNLKSPPEMRVCVAFPHIKTPLHKTEKARLAVSKTVPIEKLVHNVGQAAAIATGFATGDVELIGKSMSDAVAEPVRERLVPGYALVRKNALKAGACGITISGAGPAMIAIVRQNKADPQEVAEAMKEAFESVGLNATAFATKPGKSVHLTETK